MLKFVLPAALLLVASTLFGQIKLTGKYAKAHALWQQELRDGRNNYLKLVALEKLGESLSFGSGNEAELQIKYDDVPNVVGVFDVSGDEIKFTPAPLVVVRFESGDPLPGESIILDLDEYGSTAKLHFSNLSWRVITRGGELYLRAWHDRNPAITAFKGYEWLPLNGDLVFDAQFTYFPDIETDTVRSKLGVTENTDFVGTVSFDHNGSQHQLRVGRGGFLMVSDETTGAETYGGGRYIYLDLPELDGAVTLDFNYLYNPPCSFSELTTCLIPPPDNRLPFSVMAGETMNRIR